MTQKGKQPAFQVYVGDWRRDTQVQMASMETRGIWWEMLVCMWDAPERGKLRGTFPQLEKLLGCSREELERGLKEIVELRIGDVSNGDGVAMQNSDKLLHVMECNGIVTIINRRMYREEKQKESNRLRVRKHREKKASNEKVTPLSSSSSSTAPSKIDISNEISCFSKKNDPPENDDPNPPVEQKIPPCPHQKILDLYHEICPELSRVEEFAPYLKKFLRQRWREKSERQDLAWWTDYFHFVRDSDFLMGRKNDFVADFEWIIRLQNMTKVLNGRYHKQNGKYLGIVEWLQKSERMDHGKQG